MSEAVQPIITDRTPEEAVEQIVILTEEGQENEQKRPEMLSRGFLTTSKGKHFGCTPHPPNHKAKTLAKTLLTLNKTSKAPEPLSRGTIKPLPSTSRPAKATPLARTAITTQTGKSTTPMGVFMKGPPGPKPPGHTQAKLPPLSKAPFEQPISRSKTEQKPPESKLKELLKPEERKEGLIEPQTEQREIKDPAEKKRAIEAVEGAQSKLKEMEAFANEEVSFLSGIAGERITQRDLLFLFFEILKLFQHSKELQKQARLVLRNEQMIHIEKAAEQYESQGNTLLNAALWGGAISIIGGFAPIFGQLTGTWIFDMAGAISARFKDFTPQDANKWFEWIGSMAQTTSQSQLKWGDASVRLSESSRSLEEAFAHLSRSDEEECSRIIQEYLEQWRRISEFLDQYLRMQHDTATRL